MPRGPAGPPGHVGRPVPGPLSAVTTGGPGPLSPVGTVRPAPLSPVIRTNNRQSPSGAVPFTPLSTAARRPACRRAVSSSGRCAVIPRYNGGGRRRRLGGAGLCHGHAWVLVGQRDALGAPGAPLLASSLTRPRALWVDQVEQSPVSYHARSPYLLGDWHDDPSKTTAPPPRSGPPRPAWCGVDVLGKVAPTQTRALDPDP